MAAGPGMGATKPGSADGWTTLMSSSFLGAFFSAGVGDDDAADDSDAGGVGGASPLVLESSEPTWSFALYFLRMLSLWYFQNCFEASFPATLWMTGYGVSTCHSHTMAKLTLLATRVTLLEFGQVVYIIVDNDV